MAYAVGTSLVVVTALGLTTAGSYTASRLVDWGLVLLLVGGDAADAMAGIAVGRGLAAHKGRSIVFLP